MVQVEMVRMDLTPEVYDALTKLHKVLSLYQPRYKPYGIDGILCLLILREHRRKDYPACTLSEVLKHLSRKVRDSDRELAKLYDEDESLFTFAMNKI